MAVRVVIGDANPSVLDTLRSSLSEIWTDLEIVMCSKLDEVVEALCNDPIRADIVIFDLTMLHGKDAATLVRVLDAIRAVPMVVMSGQSGAQPVQDAIASSASSFLAKRRESLPLHGQINGAATATPLQKFDLTAEAAGVARLSDQQLRVLKLIVDGKLNKQIASEIGIAEQTVKIHVSNILKKLNVRTRTQAAVIGQKYLRDRNG